MNRSIVIVNEFSIKTGSGKGTRGGSPGNYVLRYMAREDAVETMLPLREDTDTYITKYMCRKEATETLQSISRVKKEVKRASGLGGVAFGTSGKIDDDDISMSHHKVKKVSKEIQKQFEEGKTVLKTVISFDLPYLKQMGIVPKDLDVTCDGDYKGKVDQMKLRYGIMNGMRKLQGKRFDDMAYVGVIQLDTKHVHCHLCMVDKGKGHIMPDGTQKGKLSKTDKDAIRYGIDTALDELSPVKALSSDVSHDRRNMRCFVKKFTHSLVVDRGMPQFLLACLPDDKTKWRAGTNRKDMKKANAMVRSYVEEILSCDDSYDACIADIEAYARARVDRYNDNDEVLYQKYVEYGKERLMEDCMNGVYSVLRQVSDKEKRVNTPFLYAMSMSYDEMAYQAFSSEDAMLQFGFRLRSYGSRLQHHKRERKKYHDARVSYEEEQKKGNVSPESAPLHHFYQMEEEYQEMLMAKYQHFLWFLPASDEYEEEYERGADKYDKMKRMEGMCSDNDMRRRSPESAEQYGRDVYGLYGGKYAVIHPERLSSRFLAMKTSYYESVDHLTYRLKEHGLSYEDKEGLPKIERKICYSFSDVKMMDLHRLTYDFPYDVEISKRNADAFVSMTKRRSQAYENAVDYLNASGQAYFVKELPGEDIRLMKEVANRLETSSTLTMRNVSDTQRKRRGRSVSLDNQLSTVMQLAIKDVVSTHYDNLEK